MKSGVSNLIIEKKLFLKVNRGKTAVAYEGRIKFLGYGFYKRKNGYRLRVHEKSKAKMKARVKELTSRGKVNNYEAWKIALKRYAIGWINYYKLEDSSKPNYEYSPHKSRLEKAGFQFFYSYYSKSVTA